MSGQLNWIRLHELAKTDGDLDGLLSGWAIESEGAAGDDPEEIEQAVYDHIKAKNYTDCYLT